MIPSRELSGVQCPVQYGVAEPSDLEAMATFLGEVFVGGDGLYK